MAMAQTVSSGAKAKAATLPSEVERSLEAQRRAREAGSRHGQERHALHLVHLEPCAYDVRPARHEVHVDAELGQLPNDPDAPPGFTQGRSEHHPVDVQSLHQLCDVLIAPQGRHEVQVAVCPAGAES